MTRSCESIIRRNNVWSGASSTPYRESLCRSFIPLVLVLLDNSASKKINIVLRKEQKGRSGPGNNKQNGEKTPRKKLNIVTGNYGSQMISAMTKGYGATLAMYPSTLDFARVYSNPFEMTPARMPVLPVYATKMVRNFVAGRGVTNGTGIGFVTIHPAHLLVYDLPCVFYSNGPASPPFITNDIVTYSDVSQNFAVKTPYKVSDLQVNSLTPLAARIVAVGIRLRYQGTNLQKAGRIYTMQTNPKVSLNDYDIGALTAQNSWKEYSYADDKWKGMIRMITARSDTEFLRINEAASGWVFMDQVGSSSSENVNYMGVIVQGTPNTAFEWQIVCHAEYAGTKMDNTGITKIDTAGSDHIISSFHRERFKDNTTPDHAIASDGSTNKSKFLSILKGAAKGVLGAAGTFLPEISPLTSGLSNWIGK